MTATRPINTSQQQAPAPTVWSDRLLNWADRNRRVLLTTLVLAYCIGFNGQWRVEPDSALYLTLARNLAAGHGYTYHGQMHQLAYPGLPYAMAGLMKVFGPRCFWAGDLLMLGCALGTLALTYRLFLLHAGRPTAVVVTCGVGVTRTFYRYAFQIMTDMPFLLGVMAFLAGWEAMLARRDGVKPRPRWYDWALLLGGLALAAVTRPTVLALLPVVLIVVIQAAASRAVPWCWAAAGVVVIAVATAVFLALDPPQYAIQVAHQFTSEADQEIANVAQNSKDILTTAAVGGMFGMKFGAPPPAGQAWPWYAILGVGANIALGLALIALGLSLLARRPVWGLWVAATVAMMVLVLPTDRYFLQVLPLLVYGWWLGLRWVNRRLPRPWGNLAFGLLFVWGMAPNLGLVGGLMIEQHRRPFLAYYKEGKYQGVLDLADRLPTATDPQALIVAPPKTGRVLTFLTHRHVVELTDLEMSDLAIPNIFVISDPTDPEYESWAESWVKSLGRREAGTVETIRRHGREPLILWRTERINLVPSTRRSLLRSPLPAGEGARGSLPEHREREDLLTISSPASPASNTRSSADSPHISARDSSTRENSRQR